jgi:hypothetical protein
MAHNSLSYSFENPLTGSKRIPEISRSVSVVRLPDVCNEVFNIETPDFPAVEEISLRMVVAGYRAGEARMDRDGTYP